MEILIRINKMVINALDLPAIPILGSIIKVNQETITAKVVGTQQSRI